MTTVSEQLMSAAVKRAQAAEIQVNGAVTRYWSYPALGTALGQIVFIHGYRGNHHGLEAIAGALPNFDVIIPDLPGFGASTPLAAQHSLANYSGWLKAFIDGLALEKKPTLLGHSFGSIICASFAAKNQSISSLILVNPVSAPALSGPKAALTLLARGFFGISQKLPLKQGLWLLRSWPMVRGMSIVMTKSREPKLRRWVHAQHDANFNDFASRTVAIEGYLASTSHNVGEYAPHFTVPTLLITGALDDITSPKQQHEMAATINAPHRLIEHPGVGHLTHYEIPGLVAADIDEFLKALP